MQDAVLVICVAILLVSLLWSVKRGRADQRLRFWLFAWSFVLIHFVSLLWHPASSFALQMRQAYIATLEVFAGVCFLLSDSSIATRRRRMLWVGLVACVPAMFAIGVILFAPQYLWLLPSSILASHVVAIFLAHRYAAKNKTKFLPLGALLFLSAAWMLGALAQHRPELILASIPSELFLINALLFSRNYLRRSSGNVVTSLGFVLWALSSLVMITLRRLGIPEVLFPSLLHLPQFLVAVGMMLIILEEDAEASQHLASEYQDLFNNNPNSLWIVDVETMRFLNINGAAAAMHGYTLDEFCKARFTDLIPPSLAPTIFADMRDNTPRSSFRSLHVKKDGTIFPVSVTEYNVQFHDRIARMCLCVDLTEQDKMNSRLVYQVRHDLLTGLPSHRAFIEQLEGIVDMAREEETGCALIILRICRFDKINDNFGRPMGDFLLREVTRILGSALGPMDALGRTAGREFAIALGSVPDGDAAEATAISVQQLFSRPLIVDGHKIDVTIRMGFSVFPEDSDDAMELWCDATRAQLKAEDIYSESPVRLDCTAREQASEDDRVESVMRKALIDGGFELAYQPILDPDRNIKGFEALFRLRDADGSMISPAVCIPVAETTGLIVPVGRWVVREVCRQLAAWRDAGLDVVTVAINISAKQIILPNFCNDVSDVLAEFDIDPSLIHFELTESSVMIEETRAFENMTTFANQGFRLSIDDFGTGFSSLARLSNLPVSQLKIDRSFVNRMFDAKGTLPIVRTIISMAHSLHMNVVAEGVEVEEQFDMLSGMGCNYFQGYLFSKPVTPERAGTMLSRTYAYESIPVDAAARTRHPLSA